MKEPDWVTCTEEQLWKYVASHLVTQGIDTILVGGAVVAIYSEGAYRSGDLDFVQLNVLGKKIPEIMKQIGFTPRTNRQFFHPKCKHLSIEFASGPVGIGDDYQIDPAEVRVDGKVIKIYSPTDCIRDRLASYIHFKALECLDQAVLVAKRQPFDLAKVKKWCRQEGAAHAFDEFQEKLKSGK